MEIRICGLRRKLLLVMLLVLSGLSYAQETTFEVSMPDSGAIVRQIDSNNWIVYSYGKGNTFYWITPTNPTTRFLVLQDDTLRINDMEIFDNKVWFCGTKLSDKNPRALFGYFSLNNFPNSTVFYDLYGRLASFNKLDFFKTSGSFHAVMTASYHGGNGTMVDAWPVSAYIWNYSVASMENQNELFDDVAVTDNYVVFSSLGNIPDSPFGPLKIWFHPRPSLSGVPLFGSSVQIRQWSTVGVTNALLEYMHDDYFAVAIGYRAMTAITTAVFNNLSCNNSVSVTNLVLSSPLDVKYNTYSGGFDILTNLGQYGSPFSEILHLDNNHFLYGGSVDAHEYWHQQIHSIDYLSSTGSRFVGAGHGFPSSTFRVYRYVFNNWYNCTQKVTFPSVLPDIEFKPHENDLLNQNYQRQMSYRQSWTGEILLSTICNQ